MKEAELAAEAGQVGAEFRLGQPGGTWTAKWYRRRAGCGVALIWLLILGAWWPIASTSGPWRPASEAIAVALMILAIAMASIPPTSWLHRLHRYDLGVVFIDPKYPEPVVLRWAELASVTVEVKSGYEGPYLAACELHDQAGTTIRLTNNWRKNACQDAARLAEDQLARRLMPALIARYEAGEPVTVGHLTIDQWGISSAGSATAVTLSGGTMMSRLEWRMPWQEMLEVKFTTYGTHVVIKRTTTKTPLETAVDGLPNDFLARLVITHAARRAGIVVAGD
jgi:hypothetical protein